MKSSFCVLLSSIIITAAAQQPRFEKIENGVIVYPVSSGAKAVQLKVWSSKIIQFFNLPTLVVK